MRWFEPAGLLAIGLLAWLVSWAGTRWAIRHAQVHGLHDLRHDLLHELLLEDHQRLFLTAGLRHALHGLLTAHDCGQGLAVTVCLQDGLQVGVCLHGLHQLHGLLRF